MSTFHKVYQSTSPMFPNPRIGQGVQIMDKNKYMGTGPRHVCWAKIVRVTAKHVQIINQRGNRSTVRISDGLIFQSVDHFARVVLTEGDRYSCSLAMKCEVTLGGS